MDVPMKGLDSEAHTSAFRTEASRERVCSAVNAAQNHSPDRYGYGWNRHLLFHKTLVFEERNNKWTAFVQTWETDTSWQWMKLHGSVLWRSWALSFPNMTDRTWGQWQWAIKWKPDFWKNCIHPQVPIHGRLSTWPVGIVTRLLILCNSMCQR